MHLRSQSRLDSCCGKLLSGALSLVYLNCRQCFEGSKIASRESPLRNVDRLGRYKILLVGLPSHAACTVPKSYEGIIEYEMHSLNSLKIERRRECRIN